jgi:hypothetical protein
MKEMVLTSQYTRLERETMTRVVRDAGARATLFLDKEESISTHPEPWELLALANERMTTHTHTRMDEVTTPSSTSSAKQESGETRGALVAWSDEMTDQTSCVLPFVKIKDYSRLSFAKFMRRDCKRCSWFFRIFFVLRILLAVFADSCLLLFLSHPKTNHPLELASSVAQVCENRTLHKYFGTEESSSSVRPAAAKQYAYAQMLDDGTVDIIIAIGVCLT